MDGLWEKMRAGGESSSSLSSRESLTDERQSWFKVYLLVGTTGLLALLSGFLLRVGEFGYGTLVFVIWAAVITVQSLALKHIREILLASGLCTLGFILPFWGASLWYWGATALIVFLLLLAIHDRGRRGGKNMVKIRFSHVARPVMGLILTVGVIIATFLFSVHGAAIFTEQSIKRTVDLTVTPIVKGYIKDFSGDAKLGDVLKSMALQQIDKSSGSESLSGPQKQLLAAQSAKEMNALLKEKTGFNFQEGATVSSNLHALISEKTNNLLGPGSPWGLLILFAIIFLLVKSIEFILYIPLGLLAFMLYELLIAFSFIAVQSESVSKEVITLP